MIVEMIDESMALAQKKGASPADAGMQMHFLHQPAQARSAGPAKTLAVSVMN
jgi:hypothetical protein